MTSSESIKSKLQTVPKELLDKLAELESPILLERANTSDEWVMRELDVESLKPTKTAMTDDQGVQGDRLLIVSHGKEKIFINPREMVARKDIPPGAPPDNEDEDEDKKK
jgi:hypothetical protein